VWGCFEKAIAQWHCGIGIDEFGPVDEFGPEDGQCRDMWRWGGPNGSCDNDLCSTPTNQKQP
jgi:hypothetical protein